MLKLPSRRDFFTRSAAGFASVALGALLAEELQASPESNTAINPLDPLRVRLPHIAPRAKQVIFLFQYGGPSTFDLLDYKPLLNKLHGTELPDEVRQGQRLTSMSGKPDRGV